MWQLVLRLLQAGCLLFGLYLSKSLWFVFKCWRARRRYTQLKFPGPPPANTILGETRAHHMEHVGGGQRLRKCMLILGNAGLRAISRLKGWDRPYSCDAENPTTMRASTSPLKPGHGAGPPAWHSSSTVPAIGPHEESCLVQHRPTGTLSPCQSIEAVMIQSACQYGSHHAIAVSDLQVTCSWWLVAGALGDWQKWQTSMVSGRQCLTCRTACRTSLSHSMALIAAVAAAAATVPHAYCWQQKQGVGQANHL